MYSPIAHEISYQDPYLIFVKLQHLPYCVFLDSSKTLLPMGRYSFIGIDPFSVIRFQNNKLSINGTLQKGCPFTALEELLSSFPLQTDQELPPLQGGAIGLFSYDLAYQLEQIPRAIIDDMQFPDMLVGLYDLVIAFDHHLQKAWIFSSGFPEKQQAKRLERAESRLEYLLKQLDKDSCFTITDLVIPPECIISNFDPKSYIEACRKVIDYIYAGDIFEANLSQRFRFDLPELFSAFELYHRLRIVNPAPFSAFFNTGNCVICSASPERFIKLNDRKVETRPIKGTSPRSKDPMIDKQNAKSLERSEKDRAENIMIVDLMRNDLSRVCLDDSIQVTQLCGLESFATVHHLVSAIEGYLAPGKNAIDLLKASFPGGSITGAPKLRAMEIIYELEPNQRGPYCGSMGYLGFDGTMDTSILIRTFAIKNQTVTVQAGGAIVSDSDPEGEYQETLDKVMAMKKAVTEKVVPA